MILSDYHMHTTFCDGNNTPEEMVLSAIDKGMTRLGLVCHSYTFFDETYCIKKDNIEIFLAEMKRLKEKYLNKIELFCGVEQDYYSDLPTDGFDYVIGSVHYLKQENKYFSIDHNVDIFSNIAQNQYGGDFYLMAEDYYDTLANVVEKTNADIIGHLDLITKFNEQKCFFDENSTRYLTAAKKCIDKLIPYGKPFEINTGAISRGYRTTPYPSNTLINYIKKNGGRFILSSDAHSKDGLCFQFDKLEKLV